MKINKTLLRRITALGLATTTLVSVPTTVSASNITIISNQTNTLQLDVSKNINIYVNEQLYLPKDANGNTVYPFLANGTNYLPLRALANLFGAEVSYDGVNRRVNLSNLQKGVINFQPSNTSPVTMYDDKLNVAMGPDIYVDGKPLILTDVNGNIVNTYIIDGTTYLPVRNLANLFDVSIKWENGSIYISNYVKETNYPNLSSEMNVKLKNTISYAITLSSELPNINELEVKYSNVSLSCTNKLIEMMKVKDNSPELLNCYNEMNALYEELTSYIVKIRTIATREECETIATYLQKLPATITDNDINSNYVYSAVIPYMNTIDFTYNNYKQVLSLSSDEKIKEWNTRIDNIYNKYLGIVNAKVMHYSLNLNFV